MIYLDTSALVKRYVREKGSGRIEEMLLSADMVSTSKLAFPELLSALAKKRRYRDLTEKSFRTAVNRFEEDWRDFLIIDFHDDLFPIIRTLIAKHPLRGADAVHLSSALWLAQSSRLPLVFCASDGQLITAARAEGIETLDPETA